MKRNSQSQSRHRGRRGSQPRPRSTWVERLIETELETIRESPRPRGLRAHVRRFFIF